MNRKLRIAILLDDFKVPHWAYRMVEIINNSISSEIVLLVKNESIVKEKQSILKNIWSARNKLIYTLYRKFDRKFFKTNPDAFERKNILDIVSVPKIDVAPRKTKFCDWIVEEDIDIIRGYEVDIFIRMGFRILKGDILKIANYGVWSYHHGDNDVNRGGPAGFWEVMKGHPETGVILQILNDNLDAGAILFKSYSLTNNISVNRNINNYYWKALSFLPSKIDELYKFGEVEFFKKIEDEKGSLKFYDKPLYRDPENGEMLVLLGKKLFSEVEQRFKNLFYFDQWILMFKLNKSPSIATSLYQFKKIIPPKDRIWADPFITYKKGKYYIFIEELLFSQNKGFISVIEMDDKGNYTKPEKVLERDYHLSYPQIIEERGEVYMLPETKSNKSIELYKCLQFPFKWRLEKVLMKGVNAVDSTIFYHNEKYWMFTNMVRNHGASSHDELFLFHSDELKSNNWIDHPQNPIVSDVKKARPAGKIFIMNEKIYRPSQNCSGHYGYGLKINEIIIINENVYEERTVDSIEPDWDRKLKGTHTINTERNLTMIDGIYRRSFFGG
jgi:hypothetical protein